MLAKPRFLSRRWRRLYRLGEIWDNVEADSINVEKYVKELSAVTVDLTTAYGIMPEQEHLRFVAMFLSRNIGGGGREGGFRKGVMETSWRCG